MIPPFVKNLYKQYIVVGCCGFLLLLLLGALIWALKRSSPPSPAETVQKTTHIETASTRLNPQEIWTERLELETKEAKASVEKLEKKIKSLESMIMESIRQSAQKEEELEAARLELQAREDERDLETSPSLSFKRGEEAGREPAESLRGMAEQPVGVTIKKVVLNFSKSKKKSLVSKKTVDTTLPAGAFAKGVLLAGVDASTSIQASADPRPILVRFVDDGTLPRYFKSNLKNCHVLASAFGDLSSERVYMRLEKLTCTEASTGEIIETQVSGYVSGEDGKAGMRGTIVDRAGESIRNSLIGGFFSGIGNFMAAQQQRSIFPVSPFGQTSALSTQHLLGAGASQGMSNALEKYADFFIKRAEQLQPVIQIAAGRVVDIVFTQGVAIDQSHISKARGRVREGLIRQQVSHVEEEGLEGALPPAGEKQEEGL